jgi:phosphatidylinositol alpha-1,6-mannosyltransferase
VTEPAAIRALLAAYDFPPIGGGISRFLGEIARHAPVGSLHVSTGRTPGSEETDAHCASRVDRVAVPSDRLRTLPGLTRWAWQAERLARIHRPAFTWAGNLKPAGYVAWWLDLRCGLPYGLLVYGRDLQRLAEQVRQSSPKRRLARAIVGGAAGAVALSAWTAERFRDLAGELGVAAADDQVRVLRPGVDAGRFRPGLATDAVRQRYGLDHRSWLLTVARLVPHKGVDRALEVVARLRGEGLDIGYAVVGTGPDEPRLRRLAEQHGLGNAVRLLGSVPDEDLPAVYNLATLYLGLSREEGIEVEGFGLALLEASACALPVVAGQGGGTSDAVADGRSGYLVDGGLAEAAAARVRALLADPVYARTLGLAGRTRAERDFAWVRVVRDLDDAACAFTAARARRAGR